MPQACCTASASTWCLVAMPKVSAALNTPTHSPPTRDPTQKDTWCLRAYVRSRATKRACIRDTRLVAGMYYLVAMPKVTAALNTPAYSPPTRDPTQKGTWCLGAAYVRSHATKRACIRDTRIASGMLHGLSLHTWYLVAMPKVSTALNTPVQ